MCLVRDFNAREGKKEAEHRFCQIRPQFTVQEKANVGILMKKYGFLISDLQ
jgi:hypothetical protein